MVESATLSQRASVDVENAQNGSQWLVGTHVRPDFVQSSRRTAKPNQQSTASLPSQYPRSSP
jgi:hypothetical protein